MEVSVLLDVFRKFWKSDKKRQEVEFEGLKLIVLRRFKPRPYAINCVQNQLFGLAYVPETDELVPGYPHLNNWRSEKLPQGTLVEVKLNGTNIGLTLLKDGTRLIRTRQCLFAPEFPVMLFSESFLRTLKGESGRRVAERFRKLRSEMVEKYPDLYTVKGDFEYVYLRSGKAMELILSEDFWEHEDILTRYIIFGELVGRVNPIQIDENAEAGIYDFDIDYLVFDIMDKSTLTFLPREEKEKICRELGLKVVPLYSATELDVATLRKEAEKLGEEGWVAKLGEGLADRWKVKTELVLEFARRGWAIQKGIILFGDLMNAINRGMEVVGTNAHVDELVPVVVEELLSDYPRKIVEKNMRRIREACAIELAKIIALEEVDKMLGQGLDKGAIFRELNTVLPRRAPWLKEWIDFEREKELKKLVKEGKIPKKELELMKKRRTRILQPVITYILKKKFKK